MADWSQNADTALTVLQVNGIVEQGGGGVPDQRREEDERHDEIFQVVVLL